MEPARVAKAAVNWTLHRMVEEVKLTSYRLAVNGKERHQMSTVQLGASF